MAGMTGTTSGHPEYQVSQGGGHARNIETIIPNYQRTGSFFQPVNTSIFLYPSGEQHQLQ